MSHTTFPLPLPAICDHNLLNLTPSTHAAEVGYCIATAQQKATVLGKRKRDIDDIASPSSFPAPLVLPGDELSLDPHYPGQSLDDWRREENRNEVTRKKNVIYVAGPPDVAKDVGFIRTWSNPQPQDNESRKEEAKIPVNGSSTSIAQASQALRVEDILDYLGAFYHGMPVKMLPQGSLCFASWGNGKTKTPAAKSRPGTTPRFIGLKTSTECIRIRTRASLDGIFKRQLNLDDLLDTAISILPEDAYALLLLVQHDLFEDADDEFVCGRAYGGSRVAVISTARYNPSLDTLHSVEHQHAWPASHCAHYMKDCCDTTTRTKAKAKRKGKTSQKASNPTIPPLSSNSQALQAAVSAYTTTSQMKTPSFSLSSISDLWLSRICRTASHELGHCFGIDHCIYHACAMQGSASLSEDVRQPPYLCPIDLAKVLEATRASKGGNRKGAKQGEGESEQQNKRYEALLKVCTRHQEEGMFAAFGAWIRERLNEGKIY